MGKNQFYCRYFVLFLQLIKNEGDNGRYQAEHNSGSDCSN
jgi:hypothetical protein